MHKMPLLFGILLLLEAIMGGSSVNAQEQKYNKLTPEEERVILRKGTEMPGTGKFNKHKEKGTYTCRQCGAALYKSEDKFDSGCGWPSFDDEIPGAVRRVPDADGYRTEIVCARCGGHLGHVFLGEQLTKKNTRHCVNSISMDFIPADKAAPADDKQSSPTKGGAGAPEAAAGGGSAADATKDSETTATAIFASGCFWGTEYMFQKKKGILNMQVGYTGGWKQNPTYKEVCSGDTGHVEALEVVYNPKEVSYEELARLFFETHDPTQADGQGPDIGEQYLSKIFYTNDEQKKVAEKLIGILKEKGLKVATAVEPAQKFWPAEDYHQRYYEKTGKRPYCHAYRKLF